MITPLHEVAFGDAPCRGAHRTVPRRERTCANTKTHKKPPGEARRFKQKTSACARHEVGCHLHFNSFERCWDCPCHRSQFGIDGEVLNGPAIHPLKEVAVQDEPAEVKRAS